MTTTTCLDLFRYQARENAVYRAFVQYLGIHPDKITQIDQIPFLPIECFKYHRVQTGDWQPALTFSSSGTTGSTTSFHLIRQPEAYIRNAVQGFESHYGQLNDWVILALLPPYLERQGSSLVYMLSHFIAQAQPESGFFLYNTQKMVETLVECQKKGKRVLVWGVTYALLDLADAYAGLDMGQGVVMMETGGMKGQRQELPKETVHTRLCTAFNLPAIHSEYGMTELLSQAYSVGGGVFSPASTLRVLIRDSSDPLTYLPAGKTGGVNIIDLANADSCAFIATDDMGRCDEMGRFEILGRLDSSDVRGCNLLVS